MTEITVDRDKIIVVVDAHCALCAGGARWIAHRDKADRFRIVPMQSPLGRKLFAAHDIDPNDPASWLLLDGEQALQAGDAWAHAGQALGGLASLLRLLLLFPRPIRDWVYFTVARNRIRLFGRDDLCHMPDAEVARRLVTSHA